jgi:tRNA (cmo5U34)-methyltransferase
MGDYEFDPATYPQLIADTIPAYERLQDAVAEATRDVRVRRALELGTGTGETARRVLARHPDVALVGIDVSERMLAGAGLPDADLRVGRLEDELPAGPFELVFSALAVHHLDGPGKCELFQRVAGVLGAGGRFVLGDLIVPDDPADVITEIDGVHDTPSRLDEQLAWMAGAGLEARVVWTERDLAVIAADRG